jgi:hypothetical protein
MSVVDLSERVMKTDINLSYLTAVNKVINQIDNVLKTCQGRVFL